MENYKKMLAERLSNAVKAEYIYFEENNNGFSCDYDIPPLNPSVLSEIARNIDSYGIDCTYELSSFSGVYEDGNADNRVLQRIYVTAFPTASEFEKYKAFVAEAVKRDHKTLGNELKLFSSSNETGQVDLCQIAVYHQEGESSICVPLCLLSMTEDDYRNGTAYTSETNGQSAHLAGAYHFSILKLIPCSM